MDGISILDYSNKDVDIDEIYLIDTLNYSIRQITNDSYTNYDPHIDNDLVYYKSKRYDNSDSLFVYDIELNKTIAARQFSNYWIEDNQKNQLSDYSNLLNELKTEVIESVDRINKNGNDSVKGPIELDTAYIYRIKGSKLYTLLAQYRTDKNKMKVGIVSIGNFNNEYPPSLVLKDYSALLFINDTSYVSNDSVFIQGRIIRDSVSNSFRASFDLNSDGSSFPWDYEKGQEFFNK